MNVDFSLLKKPVVLAGALIVGILVFVLLIGRKKAPSTSDSGTASNPGQRDLSGLPPEVFIVTAPPGGVNTAPPTPPSPAPTPGPPAKKADPTGGKDANPGGFLGIRPIIRKTATGTSAPPAKRALPPVVRKQPGPTPGVARAHEIDLSRNSAPASPASGSQVHVTVAPTVRIPVGVARHFNLDTEE